MTEPVRVAVIGASGGMGTLRVRQFLRDPRSKVVAAFARDAVRLRDAVADESVPLLSEQDDVLASSDVDAVVISTCNAFHFPQVRDALQAGKHVLCEYPLVDNLEQYDELVDLATCMGVVLHHGLTVRAESHHLAMKEALAELGEPRAAHYRYYGGAKWYVQPDLRGDMFCAFHIHFIDQLVDLFGQPGGLFAHGVEREGKPSATVMVHWESGLAGTIEFGMGFTDKPAYMGTVVTTDGWCGFWQRADGIQVTIEKGDAKSVIQPPPDTSKDQDAASFLDEILGTGPPLSDLATGRNAIALCLECSRQMP